MTSATFVERAAIQAADLWMIAAPASMAEWRDNRFQALASGMNYPDYQDRKQAFNDAYAGRIAQSIARGKNHEN